jgi:hypothetical protein
MKYDPNHITNSSAENLGGVCSFEIVPKQWLQNEIKLSLQSHEALPFTLISGAAWLKGNPMQGYTGFIEESKETIAGTMYQQTLQFKINKDELSRRGLVMGMGYYEYVVVYTDGNGLRRIIGSKHKGAIVSSYFETGVGIGGNNSYMIKLLHESAEPAPGFPVTL